MVFYPIKTLVDAGIDKILIVTGGPHAGHFLRVLKNGKELGIKHLEFAFQETEGGIANALSLAEDFSDNEPVCVILGDNCTDADIKKDVDSFKSGAKIFLKKVNDPQRFGVPVFDKNKKVVKIEEKPKKPKSDYAVTGLYFYDGTVFNKIKKIKPSQRGELEITDVNNLFLKEGKLDWVVLNGYWSDAGTFSSLFRVGEYWANKKIR
jgi:glucose-1-phosphate thymidylyltransferase